MHLKKYISNSFVLRLSLLLALVAAAAVFDMYHSANRKLTEKINKIPVSDETEANKTFICTQVPTYNLKTLGTEFSVRFRFTCTQDKFLLKYYNLRTFQLMKAEALHSSFPVLSSFHSLPFNRVLYASPDDTPPLA
ncbi:MAG TPA: hypothetical protein DEH15_14130 [Marinilabiliales bacterium]|nr:hypothetical protein [Marinilabiliales bacterium]